MNNFEPGIQRIIKSISDLDVSWDEQNILITGGAGFIGSWITDVFIKLGSKVIIVDNLASGLEKNIENLMEEDNFRFIKHDVSQPIPVKEDVSYIFHLASRASPFEFTKYPIEIMKANTLGILNALEVARELQSDFLYTSTSEIYGNPDPKNIPTPETYNGNVNPIGPRSCYDEAKRAGEAFVMSYMLEYDLNARIVRIFNTYGPRMRSGNIYGRVIPNFVEQAILEKPLTIFGDGTQTRSFAYITDTVEGIFRSAFLPQTKGEVFNIGNTVEIPIITLARTISNLAGKNGRIEYHPLPIDDPKRRCPDISKANKILDWKPKTDLEEGLKEFINWYVKENNIIVSMNSS
ncbi:MAG: SDR family NAD(P)-dependent oxidoreductase [Candidatus Hermodarchaeota archaeon]